MKRREFLGGAAALPLAAQASSARPNIIFILADDLGYGDLGCYGQHRIRTPHLDRMAAEGLRFTQAYAGSTVCAPSRCTLMTGLHTGHAQVRGNGFESDGMTPGPTVASVLREAGYKTCLSGKWGLGGPASQSLPNDAGFDEFFGFLNQMHAHNNYPEHLWKDKNEFFLKDNWFGRRKQFAPDLFTEHALDFLKRRRTDPHFLFLSYTVPHANNERGQVDAVGIDVPDLGPYAGESWPEVEKAFASCVTRMDADIGRVLAAAADNTLVIFTSDNGPHKEGNHNPEFFSSRGPLRGIKRDLYEGGIRVPTIAWWKGKIQPGVSDTPWAFWDFLPTAADLAGVKSPAGLDGVSIAPVLLGNRTITRSHFYWEFHEGGFAQAVRQGDWKLVRQKPKFAPELYHLPDDIGEQKDLAQREPARVRALVELLRVSRTEDPRYPASSIL